MAENPNENIRWLIRTDSDQQIGPYSTETVLRMIRDGNLFGTEKIKRYPDGTWTKISKHIDFYDQLLEVLEKVKSTPRPSRNLDDYTVFNGEPSKNSISEMPKEDLPEVDTNETLPVIEDFDRTQVFISQKKVSESSPANEETVVRALERENESSLTERSGTQVTRVRNLGKTSRKNETGNRKNQRAVRMAASAIAIIIMGIVAIFIIDRPASVRSGRMHLLYPKNGVAALEPDKIKSSFKSAIEDFEKSTYEDSLQAQNKLVMVIEGSPKNVEARGSLCLVYKELWPFVLQDSQDMESLFNLAKSTRAIDPTGINSIYCEVVKLMTLGKNKEARGIVDYALNMSQYSTAPVLYQLKAELLAIEDDFRSASLYADKARNLWPEWIGPQLAMAYYDSLNNNLTSAIASLQAILKIYPSYKPAQIQLGSILFRNFKKIDEAFSLLSSAVASKKTVTNIELAQAHFYLSLISAERRDTKQAKEHAQLAFKLNPSDSNIKELYSKLGGHSNIDQSGIGYADLMFLADQHLRSGNCLVAQAEFKAAFELDPSNGVAAMKAGQCLWQINQTAEAINWLRKAVAADSSLISAYVLLADYLSQRYEYATAIEALNKAAQKASNHHEVLRGFGLVEYRRNNFKDAIGFLKRANQIFENDIETLISLAEAYLGDRNYSDAQKASVRAIEIDSSNVEAQVIYSKVLTQFQGIDAGELYLKELIKKYSYTIQYRMALAELLLSQERASSAQPIFQQILQAEPKNKKALIGLGQAFQAQGLFDKALKNFLTASIYDPSDAEGLMRAGILYLESQKYSNAISQFKRAQSVNPLYPRINYYMGRAYYNAGEFESALQAALAERKINPNIADSYILAAEVYSASRQFQKCAAEYQQAIKLRPQGADLYVRIAKCYRQSGSAEIAESMLSIAAGQESGNPDIYKEQGAIFEVKGDARAAMESYNKYLTLSPNAPDKREIENRILNLGK